MTCSLPNPLQAHLAEGTGGNAEGGPGHGGVPYRSGVRDLPNGVLQLPELGSKLTGDDDKPVCVRSPRCRAGQEARRRQQDGSRDHTRPLPNQHLLREPAEASGVVAPPPAHSPRAVHADAVQAVQRGAEPYGQPAVCRCCWA